MPKNLYKQEKEEFSKKCEKVLKQKGRSRLIVASRKRSLITRVLLHKKSSGVNAQSPGGMTALHLLVSSGNVDRVRALFSKKAMNPNLKNAGGMTALHLAVGSGHRALVKLLLSKKSTNPNLRNAAGMTALHLAVVNGHFDLVNQLLRREGIDPNVQNLDGMTALHLAVVSVYPAVVKRLLRKKATDPNVQNLEGMTALHLCFLDQRRADLAKILYEDKRTNGWVLSNDNDYPVHVALQNGVGFLVIFEKEERYDRLMSAKDPTFVHYVLNHLENREACAEGEFSIDFAGQAFSLLAIVSLALDSGVCFERERVKESIFYAVAALANRISAFVESEFFLQSLINLLFSSYKYKEYESDEGYEVSAYKIQLIDPAELPSTHSPLFKKVFQTAIDYAPKMLFCYSSVFFNELRATFNFNDAKMLEGAVGSNYPRRMVAACLKAQLNVPTDPGFLCALIREVADLHILRSLKSYYDLLSWSQKTGLFQYLCRKEKSAESVSLVEWHLEQEPLIIEQTESYAAAVGFFLKCFVQEQKKLLPLLFKKKNKINWRSTGFSATALHLYLFSIFKTPKKFLRLDSKGDLIAIIRGFISYGADPYLTANDQNTCFKVVSDFIEAKASCPDSVDAVTIAKEILGNLLVNQLETIYKTTISRPLILSGRENERANPDDPIDRSLKNSVCSFRAAKSN